MGQPVLSVRRLQKRVRGRQIVKDVSFDIYPGQIFGFLGPNGAGKTTTIRMLVGLIRPTAGDILLGGNDLRKAPFEALKTIGCIVENPDLYPYLSGYENLYQLGAMQGPEALERIGYVAELVNLTHRLHDKVRTYSLGMRQRLGIAQALLGNPKLLILDEPTNGLDPAGIRELRSFLRALANEGLAIFISSHLLSEIELLCDSVAIIQDGTVVRTGDVQALIAETSTEVIWRVEPLRTAIPILMRYSTVTKEQGGVTNRHGGPPADAQLSDAPSVGQYRCVMSDEQVAEATHELALAGCKVYEVARQKSTLEDVFLRSTGGAGA